MKFALFGNTYQEHKSAHIANLLDILRRKEAQICISSEFYYFLKHHTRADLGGLEVFDGNDFHADMALSVGGDGTFLKTASRVGNKGIPILGINTGRLGFLAAIPPDQMEETFEEIYRGKYLAEPRRVLKLTSNGQVLKGYPYGLFVDDYHPGLHKQRAAQRVSGRRTDHCHTYRIYGLFAQRGRTGHGSAKRHHQSDRRSSAQPQRPSDRAARRLGNNP